MHNEDPIAAGDEFARPDDALLEAELAESDVLEPEARCIPCRRR